MIKDGYDGIRAGAQVGKSYATIIRGSADAIKKKNDDFLLIIAGTTGTGKSTLGIQTYCLVEENPSVDNIALTRQDLAEGMLIASKKHGFRYLQYDEGKLNKREWQGEWSRDLLELYHDNRGKNIFHVWCTAMPELLDKTFVDARVKGFVYIMGKDKGRPRRFLYFTKNGLLKMIEAHEKISFAILKKHGKKYAVLDSWFKDYKGPLLAPYLDKKEERMSETIQNFYEKWGKQTKTTMDVANALRVSDETIRVWRKKFEKQGKLKKGEHFLVNGSGITQFTSDGFKVFVEHARGNGGMI